MVMSNCYFDYCHDINDKNKTRFIDSKTAVRQTDKVEYGPQIFGSCC